MNPSTEVPRRLAARLRFRHLQLLLALEAGGSLRAAAQSLNLTQPALSKALAEIESAFGVPLFARTARGLTPTPQGLATLRGARLLLEELAHVHAEAAAADVAPALVRIGAPPFVANGYLPSVLVRLRQVEPRVCVVLMEERVPLLLEALAEGRLDALVSTYPVQAPDTSSPVLRYEKLFDSRFEVIAPSNHPVLRMRRVAWADLAPHDWIMPARVSMLRRLIEEQFARAGCLAPLPVIESTSPVTNVQLVAAGIGLAVVPEATLQHAAVKGSVARVRVMPAVVPAPVSLISRPTAANPRLDLLREALAACRRRGRSG